MAALKLTPTGIKATPPEIPSSKWRKYLTRKGLFDKKFKSAVTREFRLELDVAIKRAYLPERNGRIQEAFPG